jgi:hypothetical protein
VDTKHETIVKEPQVTAKKLPRDISDFQIMMTEDYVYVDKTKYIYDLITTGRLYFLSRPRRFGKSLLISTLEHIFSGNKELFHDLWIGKHSDYTWPKHPVIHLDFSSLENETAEILKGSLSSYLSEIAQDYGLELKETLLANKTRELVKKLAQKNKVVFLIDEYDYPLLEHLTEPKTAKAIRDILRTFFTVIKSLEGKYMRFVFITGITKFSKASLFSGMNNLYDISLDLEVATMLGYTKDEIKHNFASALALFAKTNNRDEDALLKEMETWYDGYLFSGSPAAEKVYNPFSIIYCLYKQQFDNYWFKSATPTFLIELIKKHYYAPEYFHFTDVKLSSDILETFDIDAVPPLYTLLFQAGYLTIKSFDATRRAYTHTCPNEEVRLSSALYLLMIITNKNKQEMNDATFALRQALEEHALDTFCSQLRSLLASIPYNLYANKEAYFHSLLYLVVRLLDLDVKPEESTNKGRIDLVVTTTKNIYLFELKYNATAQEAIEQIQNKRYYEKYLGKNKPITLIGLSFNYEDKAIALDCSALPLDVKALAQEAKGHTVEIAKKKNERGPI